MKESGVEWLGEIPAHWAVKQIRRIASVFGGGTPSSETQEYWDGDIPWLTPTDVSANHGLFIERTRRNITDAGLERSAAELMPTGTVLMTSRASIGDVVINTVPMATNQGFINIIPDSDKLHNLYLALWIQQSGDYIRELGTGSTFLEVTKSSFKALPLPSHPSTNNTPSPLTSTARPPRCIVSDYNGVLSYSQKDALWDRYFTLAPQRLRQPAELYKIVKRA